MWKKDINQLYSENVAMTGMQYSCLRYILHDIVPWKEYISNENRVINGQRYLKVRNCYVNDGIHHQEDYISTRAMHEMMIIFRELEKLQRRHIVKEADLADMYHELLPWGISGRLEFINTYFGKKDAELIAYMIFRLVLACKKNGDMAVVSMFRKYYINHYTDIAIFFCNNSRYTILDKIRQIKFLRLMNLCQ